MRTGHIAILIILFGAFVPAAERPNVILIMTDDQGYGELSFHGNPILKTPNLDRLAKESIRLIDFHVAPMCTPTRGQLMTGLDAFRNGAINVSSGRTLLRSELQTMADVFKGAGYHTGIFGKWHLGDNYPYRPEDRGFMETLWFPSSHISSVPDYWENDYFGDTYMRNGSRKKYKGYCTDVFFREAIEWMKQKKSQPFFTYIPLNAPHGPHFVPEKFRAAIRKAVEKNPEILSKVPKGRRKSLVSFLAMCANIDGNIGKLNTYLKKSKHAKNTIVVFLTDNGSTMGNLYYNAGMRGKKTELWEGGHRVPCFIRWPEGGLGKPRDIGGLTQVQDLLPTLAELAGIKNVPENMDGMSLAPVFRGKIGSVPDRMLVINYSRMPNKKVNYTSENPAKPVRDGAGVLWKNWRYLENRELYDIRNDPHQDEDVAVKFPEIVTKMRGHLEKWWDGVRERVNEPQRIIIGNKEENPLMLTACEWLDVFVDQQRQIRVGTRKNGTWHLLVDASGTYTFSLRRFPRESGLKLRVAVPETKVTDGRLKKGRSLPIASAKIKIGDFEATSSPDKGNQAISFRTPLKIGKIELKTWMLDDSGNEISGAYYVYVERE